MMDWKSFVEVGVSILTTLSLIGGGLYRWHQNGIDRKERLLDADFDKLEKLLCDDDFRNKMQKNNLLRLLYYRNIKYFSGISNEVIDVIINTQNKKERNFNVNFYQIDKLYKNKLIKINKTIDDFYINEAISDKFYNNKIFVWLLWTLFVIYCVGLSVIFAFLSKPFNFILFAIGIALMMFFEFYIMNKSSLIDYLNNFKEKYE
ncbi:hypothetical protein [Moraxella porci]|uniref:hypothetical protein n=1 Tax=Moraxella porci TaxID=1288392 RepID=UPI0024474D4D|nr:hypothetical protein [Moraxella porci]MDH2272453.1 hypothetical protein [Moraxella porci]